MKNRKGVSLLEVILTVALIGLIVPIGTNIFTLGNKYQKVSASEVDMQANSRLISEQINNIARFASKTHTIPRSSFQYSENGVRDPATSYIGITKSGDVVIDEPGEPDKPRKVQYLAKKQPGIDYEIVFDKALDSDGNEMDKILSFSIVGKKDGKVVSEIVSKVDVLNSVNIDHLGTPDDPAVAIAYSMVKPGSQEWIEMSPDAYITLVLDTSGSMEWDMDGKSTSKKDSRIKILKDKALKMIDRLAALDFDIYVSVVPFSYNANNPKDFKNLQDATELQELKAIINNLNADGGTNTGDGIRRGYYQLKNKADSLKSSGQIDDYSDITQHMMILVDGETNIETKKITDMSIIDRVTGSEYTLSDADVKGYLSRSLFGNYYGGSVGSHYSFEIDDNDNNYITYFGNQKIKTYTFLSEGEQKQAINTFVIGFSNKPKDHNSLEAIGNAVNGKQFEHSGSFKPYILATDADELDFAFEQFESEVENSLWVITRPQLMP